MSSGLLRAYPYIPQRHKDEHDGLFMHMPTKHEAAESARRDRLHESAVARLTPQRHQLCLAADVRSSLVMWWIGLTHDLADAREEETVYRLDVGQDGKERVANQASRSRCDPSRADRHIVAQSRRCCDAGQQEIWNTFGADLTFQEDPIEQGHTGPSAKLSALGQRKKSGKFPVRRLTLAPSTRDSALW